MFCNNLCSSFMLSNLCIEIDNVHFYFSRLYFVEGWTPARLMSLTLDDDLDLEVVADLSPHVGGSPIFGLVVKETVALISSWVLSAVIEVELLTKDSRVLTEGLGDGPLFSMAIADPTFQPESEWTE